jgi:hypothetical protein
MSNTEFAARAVNEIKYDRRPAVSQRRVSGRAPNLLGPQGNQRISRARTAGRQVTGHDRADNEQERNTHERNRVERLDQQELAHEKSQ